MTLLNSAEAERAACPACSAVLRPTDVHSAVALRSTMRGPLPAHLRAEAAAGQNGEAFGGTSSKIQALLQVCSWRPELTRWLWCLAAKPRACALC